MNELLIIILLLVLFLPFFVKAIEQNLELFLFVMGYLAATVTGILDSTLFLQALTDPIFISTAVLLSGLLFKWMKVPIEKVILGISQKINIRLFLSIVIVILGLISSLITAIIAAIMLVSIISILKLDRKTEIYTVILACYSIGLGAVLLPIGEPLSTIATNKLDVSFFYLLHLIGSKIFVSILVLGVISYFLLKPRSNAKEAIKRNTEESYLGIIIRSLNIYLFVMGLTLLGAGYEPLVNQYLLDLPPEILYWVNSISAILDNATLAAAEISPAMSSETIEFLLFGLIISGGMLIPGNIPNIIAANKLSITSKEWARFALPFGSIAMMIMFVFLLIAG